MPSPIDRMIDEACGVKPGDFVTLVCNGCGQRKRAPKDETDPKDTAEVHVRCPKCNGGDFDLIEYFDAHGRQILPA